MKVGPLLGEHLLEIAQSNIMNGNIEKGLNTYFYTEANAFGRCRHKDPFTTYVVRQMDEIKLHEIFGY